MKKVKESLSSMELYEKIIVPETKWPYKIPENWVWVELGSCLYSGKEKQNIFDETIRYIGLEHIQNNNGIVSYGSSTELKSLKNVFKKGDILYGKLRPYLNKHDIAPFDGVCSTDILVLKSSELTINKYIHYLLDTDRLIEYAVRNSKGINLPRVSEGELLKFFIPLPPVAEQQRIVECIESLFNNLNQAKGLIQEAIDSFDNRKTVILHKAFRGELTEKWREENNLGMENWETVSLGQILKVYSGKGLTAKNMNSQGTIPVYGGNGITGYHDKSFIETSTIVIGRVGYYCGSVHFIVEPAWVTDNALIVKFNENKLVIRFLYWLLSYTDLRKNDSSTAQPVISGSKIYPTEVMIPSYAEQKEIVRIIDSLLESEGKAIDTLDLIDDVELIKKSILSLAFRGELGTNNSDEKSSMELLKTVLM